MGNPANKMRHEDKIRAKIHDLQTWVEDHEGDVDYGVFRDECRHILIETYWYLTQHVLPVRTPPQPGNLVALDLACCIWRDSTAQLLAANYPRLPGARELRAMTED